MCHLELGDHFAARDALSELSTTGRDTAITWYIQFRIDIHCATDEVTLSNVEELTKANGFQLPMLYHCAIDAQASGRNKVSLPLLNRILHHTKGSDDSENVRMPALLRCIIRLWKSDIDQNPEVDEKQLDMLCTQYEVATSMVEQEESCIRHGFNARELEWFSKNAHNTALSGILKWPSNFVIRILMACKSVTELGLIYRKVY